MGVAAVADETYLRVDYLSGSETQEALASIGRLEIADDTLRLISVTNVELGKSYLYNVRKITFMAVVPVSEIKQSAGLQIYPNPTMDALYVTGTNVGETVRVFTLNGRLVLSGTASDTVLQLPVSGLEAGVYLLQIDTQISKFIKR